MLRLNTAPIPLLRQYFLRRIRDYSVVGMAQLTFWIFSKKEDEAESDGRGMFLVGIGKSFADAILQSGN